MAVFAQPFGHLLRILYENLSSYGWSIIVFTFIVNVILLPLTIKQQKSTIGMQKIQPEIAELQKKYKDNKEKQSQELMKVYQKHGINPVGGCLPLLIQLPILIILYQVIVRPLTYMFGAAPEDVAELAARTGIELGGGFVQEINIAQKLTYEIVADFESIGLRVIDFNFFGLDLGATPDFSTPSALWLIPIFAAITTYLSTKMMQKNAAPVDSSSPAAASINTMNKIMPLVSAFFTFSFPAGIGLYWVTSNIARMAQQYPINLYLERERNPLVVEAHEEKIKSNKKNNKK